MFWNVFCASCKILHSGHTRFEFYDNHIMMKQVNISVWYFRSIKTLCLRKSDLSIIDNNNIDFSRSIVFSSRDCDWKHILSNSYIPPLCYFQLSWSLWMVLTMSLFLFFFCEINWQIDRLRLLHWGTLLFENIVEFEMEKHFVKFKSLMRYLSYVVYQF